MLYTLHIFFTAGLIIHKKTVTMVKIVASAAALNIALNIWLIPRMGLQGAAVSTLISYAVFLALIARASLSVLPLRVNAPACLRYLLAGVTSVALVSRVEFSSHFFNFLVRGSLCVSIYGVVLYGLDRRVRATVNEAFRSASNPFKKRRQAPGLTPPETVSPREYYSTSPPPRPSRRHHASHSPP